MTYVCINIEVVKDCFPAQQRETENKKINTKK